MCECATLSPRPRECCVVLLSCRAHVSQKGPLAKILGVTASMGMCMMLMSVVWSVKGCIR